ncbi:MAG: hypothetical protein AB7R89_20190 [Dehalococcoidia bacterium]
MVTVEELRQSLPYPQTYTPKVALKAALSMERQPGAGIDLVLKPYILCQDWDKRVFIHWKDSRGVRTLEITRILEDSPERFQFHVNEEIPVTYTLSPLTLACFNNTLREAYERQGNVPDFPDDAALHAWLLRR